jgi:hypothetical protein
MVSPRNFGQKQAIIVPGSKYESETGSLSGRGSGGGGLSDIVDFFMQKSKDSDNRELLRKSGIEPHIYNNADSATLSTMAAKVGGFNVDKVETSKRNTALGTDIMKVLSGKTDSADATFQGFSPSEDQAFLDQERISKRLVNEGGLDSAKVLEMLNPKKKTETIVDSTGEVIPVNRTESLAKFLAGQSAFTGGPTQQELSEGFEGEAPLDSFEDPGQDREEFGAEQLSHAEGLNNSIIASLNNDPEQVGLYMQSETYKQQLEQAQARDRDVVVAAAADLAQQNTVSNKVFQNQLDIEKDQIGKLFSEKLKKEEEIRDLERKINEEGRADDKARLVRGEERLAKLTDDSRKRVHDYNLSIFNRWEDEQKTKRKEKREITTLKKKNIKHAKALTKLLSLYHEGQIDPNISQKQAMVNALTVSDKKGSLSIEERSLLTNDDIKLLGKSEAVVYDLYDNDSGENRKYEFKTVDGVIDLNTKRLIGTTKHGLGDALFGGLQKRTRAKIEDALVDNELMKAQYDKLGKYLDTPENLNLLSTIGGFDFWQMQKRDRLGNFKFFNFAKLSKSDQLQLRRYTQMAHLTGRIFTAFRKSITGVAGPVEEFKRLEEISLSISMQGPVGFRAAYDLLVGLQEDERNILRSTLAAGNKLETPEQKASYKAGLVGRINAKINALNDQGFGNAIKDVNDMVKTGKITLTTPQKDITDDQKFILNSLNRILGAE